jgi:3-oxoacyl-[acyl-carrier protein] reductase
MLLEDKLILITGATKGIGFATSKKFAQEGAQVFINGRNQSALDKIADELNALSKHKVSTLCFDVSDPEQVKSGFQLLFKQVKGLDILVNNAGILDDALIGMVTSKQVNSVYGANTFGTLYCSQYASRLMQRRGGGSIVNISSIIGTNGNEGQAVYGGSKAAVIGMTKSLAKELAPSNICVNAIAPGFIDTDMARSLDDDKFQERIDSIKMNRIGKPEEVANVALFLASSMSSYVTGQVIGVDGGMLI